jgi:hypothetical protein
MLLRRAKLGLPPQRCERASQPSTFETVASSATNSTQCGSEQPDERLATLHLEVIPYYNNETNSLECDCSTGCPSIFADVDAPS